MKPSDKHLQTLYFITEEEGKPTERSTESEKTRDECTKNKSDTLMTMPPKLEYEKYRRSLSLPSIAQSFCRRSLDINEEKNELKMIKKTENF